MQLFKEELRKKYLFSRRILSPEVVKEKSAIIQRNFLSLPFLTDCEHVFTYVSDDRGEVRTDGIISSLLQQGKNVWIPRVDKSNLLWHLINEEKMRHLKLNSWGIPEPHADWEPITEKAPRRTICVVPGIVFDRRGYRIGHGKGFFDRFLKNNKQCISVGLCYSFQMVILCPRRNWDVPVDWIITENNVFHPMNVMER